MKLNFLYIIIALVFCNSKLYLSQKIVFDAPDLISEFETSYGQISIEAFKSSLNDEIINKKDIENYGKLIWFSIGYPNLVHSLNDNSRLFVLKPEGFDVNVEILTNLHRNKLKDAVKRKYKIDIEPNQIVALKLSRFECQLVFYKNNKKLLINGKVNQFNRFPFKLSFTSPLKTKERIAFEERLNKDRKNLNLDIECEISFQDENYRQESLTITSEQIDKINLIDSLFQQDSEVYVSKSQILSIASKFYSMLNIIDDYRISESQFLENFINDFTKQTAVSIDQYVDIDKVLSKLSKYDLSKDLKPNEIKNDLSKIFFVDNIDDHELLKLNKTEYNRLNSESILSRSVSGKYKIFSISASYNFINSQKADWQSQRLHLSEQLNELNAYTDNEIEWSRIDDIITPKGFRVFKLSKSLFNKSLIFSAIKKEYYDTPFKRKVVLDILRAQKIPYFITENSDKIKLLELKMNEIKQEFENINLKLENKTNELRNFMDFNLRYNFNLNELKLKEFFENNSNLIPKIIIYTGKWELKPTKSCVLSKYKKELFFNFTKPFKTPLAHFFTQINATILEESLDKNRIYLKINYCDKFTINWIAFGY